MKSIHQVRAALVAAPVLAVVAGSSTAQAGYICQAVEPGVIAIDAMLDEWRGLDDRGPLARGRRDRDASWELRCAFDGANLYVAVRVRDERIIRSGRRGGSEGGDDALQLALRAGAGLSAGTMTFQPGTRGVRARKSGGDGARVDDSLAEGGWQLELGVPLDHIPGWGRSTPLLLGEVSYADVDQPGGAVESRLRFASGLHFSSHVPALRSFLAHARLSIFDLKLDALAEVDGLPGTERVVAGGRFLAVLSDSFGFVELPLSSATDLERVELIDFDGDGRSSILTHYRQRGGGGSREVVTVWTGAAGGALERALAFEVALELGRRRLTNRWSLVPAGQHRSERTGRPGRLDILVEVGPQDNAGWDVPSFARITPSPDTRPILTPWSDKRAVVYYFDGEVALEGHAK